jgi:hypothetical protein
MMRYGGGPHAVVVRGWWRAAANEAHYRATFRLTEFGLGD